MLADKKHRTESPIYHTSHALRDIETAASQIKVEEARYSEAAQRMINR